MKRLLALALVLFAAGTAQARPGEHLRLEATTVAPIYVGGRLSAELPARLRLSTALGVLPRAYVEGINEVVLAFDGYDEQTADVIEETLSSSLVWRTHAGWRPFAGAGFYLEAGYGLITLGGGTSEETLLALAVGVDRPGEGPGALYDVEATVHMLDAEIGWEWWVADRLSLRAGLGVATTLASSSSVDRTGGGLPFVSDAFGSIAENELDEILERYVHTPTLSFAVGYRLF